MGNNEDDPDEGARDLSEMALSLLDRDMDGRVAMEVAMEVESSPRLSLLHLCDTYTASRNL